MARRSCGRLPSFKVIVRSSSGRVSHRSVPRGCQGKGLQKKRQDSTPGVVLDGVVVAENLPENTTSDPEILPTVHEVLQKKSVESWEKMRHQLLKASVESEALPPDTLCFVCGLNKASHRCLQCSSSLFYCLSCYSAAHVKTNLFHKGEIWEVSTML